MTFSQKLQREVQPGDFLLSVGKTVTKVELAIGDQQAQLSEIRKELIAVAASQLVDIEGYREDGHHTITFKLDCFVVPKDEFFGLVLDMANAIVAKMNKEKHV